MPLRPEAVPTEVRFLLPLTERWGVGDDADREGLVEQSSMEELRLLVEAVDRAEDQGLYEWLTSEESYAEEPTPEYVAVTCLTMAADSARRRLRRA